MKKIISRTAARIIPFAVLFVAALSAVLYAGGAFEPSSGIPDDTDSAVTTTDSVTDAPDTEKAPDESQGPSDSQTPPEDTDGPGEGTTTPPDDDDDPFFSQIGAYESFSDMSGYLSAGYNISYRDFSSSSTLAKITLSDGIRLPSAAEGQMKLSVLYKSALDDPDGIPYPVRTFIPEASMAVELYMGYIITDNGTVVSLFSSDGRLLGSFSRNYFIPAYTRDTNSNPLFYLVGEGFGTYYRFDSENGRFVRSNYDDETETRGLYFDYTPDFGIENNGCKRFSTLLSYKEILPANNPKALSYLDIITKNQARAVKAGGLERIFMYLSAPSGVYGYVDNRKNIKFEIIERRWSLGAENYLLSEEYKNSPDEAKVAEHFKFLRLYNFTDGLCAGVTPSGALGFFDAEGKAVISRDHVSYTPADRKLLSSYAEPLYKGAESIGSLYFDNGYVRVRVVDVDSEFTDKMSGDRDILIDKNGKEFKIPSGMKLISYSDGILLLQNSRGLYGYFSVTENKWIAQPEFTFARPFAEGLGVIGFEGRGVGVIDTSGNLIIPYKYEYISQVSSGVIALYKNGGWTLVAKLESAQQ